MTSPEVKTGRVVKARSKSCSRRENSDAGKSAKVSDAKVTDDANGESRRTENII